TIDLTKPATTITGGNANNILDGPISLSKIVIVRNGSQPATGTFLLDNIRTVSDGWSLPTATNPAGAKNFVPSAGQTTTVSFTPSTPGDYQLQLLDPTGRVKTFNGTAANTNQISVSWDGTSDSGDTLAGSISSVLSYDTTPDGSLSSTPVKGGNPYTTGIAARFEPANQSSPVGQNGELTTLDSPASVDYRAKLMENAYVRYDREEFEWKRVEPSPGYYDWSKFDQTIAATDARNINVIGRLLFSAPWASSAPAGTAASDVEYYPPTNLTDFTDYVTAVVHRYKGSVHVWEVWNEPNSSLYWKPAPDPVAYAAMLKATYAAIKAEDPTATVINGGLVGFDYKFMDALRANNALSSIDGLGLHTFVNQSPDGSQSETWLDGAEAYLARYAPGKKIWITEMGWSTCSSTDSTCPSPVTEAQQSQYLAQAYLDAASRGIAEISWWNLVEYGDSGDHLDNFGLVERNGRLKPAYTALVNVGQALDQKIVAGTIAPTANGQSTLVDDMASTSGWNTYKQGGGTATLVTGSGRHGGVAGFTLTYNFSGASTGVDLQTNKPVPGSPTALSLWVFGDKTNSPIYIKFTDATGENFQGLIGDSAGATWKRMTLYLDGGNPDYQHYGGNNDGVVDYPIAVTDIFVYKSLVSGQSSGQVYLDDLSAGYGPITRGVVLYGAGTTTQAVYGLSTQSADLPIPGPSASVTTGSSTSTVTAAADGTINLPLGAEPSYVTSTLGVSAVTSLTSQPVSLYWTSADRTTATIQVLSSDGTVIRVLRNQVLFDSGPRTDVWDGKKTDGTTASVGTYRFRVVIAGVNGATATVDRQFTRTK
ncbi:MAG: hypothetical protein JWQ19_2111, partial [Subtercola sp.]|nr:hypothetical protein [Subtercola sp.]